MKKLLFAAIMAAIAVTFTSCTNESICDIEQAENEAKACAILRADSDQIIRSFPKVKLGEVVDGCKLNDLNPEIRMNRLNIAKFIMACKELLEVHKDFDYFRALLDERQLAMLDSDKFDLDIAVSIIFAWWNNDETWDIMVEYPDWDDFLPNMPEKYWDLYPFYM